MCVPKSTGICLALLSPSAALAHPGAAATRQLVCTGYCAMDAPITPTSFCWVGFAVSRHPRVVLRHPVWLVQACAQGCALVPRWPPALQRVGKKQPFRYVPRTGSSRCMQGDGASSPRRQQTPRPACLETRFSALPAVFVVPVFRSKEEPGDQRSEAQGGNAMQKPSSQ